MTDELTRERSVYRLVAFAHPLVHLYEGVISAVLPLLAAVFAVDYFRLGIAASGFSYAYALGALPAGFLASKVGPRRLISLYLLGAACASAATGFLSGTFLLFGLFSTSIGAFCGLYHPAGNTLISHSIRKSGTGFGIHGISGSLGTALAPITAAWIATLWGWPAPYVVLAALGLAVGLASLKVPEAAPAAHAAAPQGEAGRSAGPAMLALFYIGVGVLGLAYRGVLIFLPTYLGGRLSDLDPAARVALGGSVATAALLFGTLGQYVGGRLCDRMNPGLLYMIAQLGGGLLILVMVAAGEIAAGPLRAVLMTAAAAAMAFFYFAAQPTQNVMVTRLLDRRRHGVGFGVLFFTSAAIGSAAAVLSGWLADLYGFGVVFLAMGAFMLLAGALCLPLMFAPNVRLRSIG